MYRRLLLLIIIGMSLCIAKTTIAVLNFDARGISEHEAATLTDRFRNELTKTGQYTVVERGKMEEVLVEQGFQQSGCTSEECFVEAGQMLGVQQMVGGAIGQVGNVYTVSVRIIDVGSGEIISVTDYDHQGDLGGLLMSGMKNAAVLLISPGATPKTIASNKAESTPVKENPQIQEGTVTDIDGNVYRTVKIGAQVWMAENLVVTRYRNGGAIPNVTSNSEWTGLSTGAYSVYGNDPANADIYGNLYNWYAVDDSRNIAPEGWHVPTDAEWKELEMHLGMSQSEADQTSWRGTNKGSKLAGNADLWNDGAFENNAAFGSSGFKALPGGYRNYYGGNYYHLGSHGYFWSSSEYYNNGAWARVLNYNYSGVYRYSNYKEGGRSIRCVRDF